MGRMYSPLRYPGGKTSMLDLMVKILRENDLERFPYLEPFAGGCGLALGLLFRGHVSEIHINDVDPAIWSFWYCALNRTEELVEAVQKADLTIAGWREQREICLAEDVSDPLSLGFSAFYLNRTNRSGIIKGAGVIGGLEQTGAYKIDCRFNREDLAKRIRRVAKYKGRIHLTREDALDFLEKSVDRVGPKAMYCVDPPYFKKGSSLYTSYYKAADHAVLADAIMALDRPWVVTYDNVNEIRELYAQRERFSFDVNYSVQTKRKASELLVASEGLTLPAEIAVRRIAS